MKKLILFIVLIGSFARAGFLADTAPFSIIGNKIVGMKILHELPKSSALAKLGVKKGDIVVEANGTPIINEQAGMDAYNANKAKTAVVLRNNAQIILRSGI